MMLLLIIAGSIGYLAIGAGLTSICLARRWCFGDMDSVHNHAYWTTVALSDVGALGEHRYSHTHDPAKALTHELGYHKGWAVYAFWPVLSIVGLVVGLALAFWAGLRFMGRFPVWGAKKFLGV